MSGKSIESIHYTEEFYKQIQHRSQLSAKTVLPYLFKYFKPSSVVDIGCGTGDWLSAFQSFGITDYVGVDGDYVDHRMLQIPESHFVKYDLKQRFKVERRFDLAMSVEVGEHLPNESSEVLVETLSGLSDFIMFSAATQGQGGTYHINEQPHQYWINKFEKRGYKLYDILRQQIWHLPYVECWYRQNILLFIKEDKIKNYPGFLALVPGYNNSLPQKHPEFIINESNRKGFLAELSVNPIYALKKYVNLFKSRRS
jgi:SAM-dependent methyltransferase